MTTYVERTRYYDNLKWSLPEWNWSDCLKNSPFAWLVTSSLHSRGSSSSFWQTSSFEPHTSKFIANTSIFSYKFPRKPGYPSNGVSLSFHFFSSLLFFLFNRSLPETTLSPRSKHSFAAFSFQHPSFFKLNARRALDMYFSPRALVKRNSHRSAWIRKRSFLIYLARNREPNDLQTTRVQMMFAHKDRLNWVFRSEYSGKFIAKGNGKESDTKACCLNTEKYRHCRTETIGKIKRIKSIDI